MLAISYCATVAGPHDGKLHGATYKDAPLSWFLMTVMWVHFFVGALTLAAGVLGWAYWDQYVRRRGPEQRGDRNFD